MLSDAFSADKVSTQKFDLARPSFISFGRTSSGFARHSPPSAAPPVLLVIHPLRPRLPLRPSFTPFCRASCFARHSPPSAAPLPVSLVIHPLQPHLLRLRPSFTPFGRTSSGFARHSRLDRESSSRVFSFSKLSFSAIRVIRRAFDLARPSFTSFGRPCPSVVHLLRPSLLPLRPPFTSFVRASSGFVRHSPPLAAPPVLLVIHPLRPHLPFCSSFTPFGRASSGFARHFRLDRESSSRVFSFSKLSFSAIRVIRRALDLARPSFISFGRAFSRFARHSPPSVAPLPVSPVIHPLRPRLFRFRSSFTPFGRTSSGFVRHSPPSAAPLPVSSVIPGLTGNLLRGFSVSRNCLFLQSG